jgi:hypothetical protein
MRGALPRRGEPGQPPPLFLESRVSSRRESGEYRIADALSEDVFRPASFEGLEVPLRELWA